MLISDSYLIDLIERSSTVAERLTQDYIPQIQELNRDRQRKDKMAKWCSTLANGNWDLFERRLQWDNWNKEDVEARLSRVKLDNPNLLLSSWANTFREILEKVLCNSNKNRQFSRAWQSEEIDIITPILNPFVVAARELLASRVGEHLAYLSEGALADFEQILCNRLMQLCTPALKDEYANWKQNHVCMFWQNITSFLFHQEAAFIKKILNQDILSFFQTYPVLARLVATTIDFWVDGIVNFIDSFRVDKQKIEEHFFSTIDQGKIISITSNLSDLHHCGKTVIIATFENNSRLVYKPRNLSIDLVYNEFLTWLNSQDNKIELKPLKILTRDRYGWVEYVEHQACENFSSIQRYYHRAGMLVCLTYILGGTDFHYENLIACGEYPVLIDLETLMHPQLEIPDTAAQKAVSPKLWNSVLKSGLLTRWDLSADGQLAHDVSGLGGINHPKKLGNSDGKENTFALSPSNIPRLKQTFQLPQNFSDQIVDGFQQMYIFFMTHREMLLESNTPFSAFQDLPIRFVFRATQIYKTILHKTLSPEYLIDGTGRSIELERINQSLIKLPKKPQFWSLIQIEQRSLNQMDIPHFSLLARDNSLSLLTETNSDINLQSSTWDMVVAKVRNLNDFELKKQINLIQSYLTVPRTKEPGIATADAFYQQQLTFMQDAGDLQGEVIVLYQLGKYEARNKQPKKARDYYIRALSLAEKIDFHQVKQKILSQIKKED